MTFVRARVTVERAALPDVAVRLVARAALERSLPVAQFLDRLVLEARRAESRLKKD